MAYHVEIKNSAAKEIAALPKRVQRRVFSIIEGLADKPRPQSVRKLTGSGDYYRLRVGDYRIVYHIEDDVLTVLIIRVGHRKDIYRKK